jgi:hypothetical protein
LIVIKLQGGLGNQMFQYAIALNYSNTVYLDFCFLETNNISNNQFTKRDFELSIFPNLVYKKFTKFHSKIAFSNNIIYRILRKLFFIKFKYVKQIENEFVTIEKSKHMYIDGFFQSEKYFILKSKEIIDVFHFPELDKKNNEVKKKILQQTNSVCLHIRRGDYLKPDVKKYHGILPKDYYTNAVNLITEKHLDAHFFVFSDDENYAKEQYGHLINFTIIQGNSKNSWKDMALMSVCKHHIIANSSFSWWGAWLSTTRNSIKIVPKKWFNSEVATFDIDIIKPLDWIKM